MNDIELVGLGATEANGSGEDFDLHSGDVTVELVRRDDGSWEFWNVVLPGGHRIGGQQTIGSEAVAWLEAERAAGARRNKASP